VGCNLQRGVLHPVVGCNRGLLHEMGLVREGGSFFQSGKNEGNENTGISGQDKASTSAAFSAGSPRCGIKASSTLSSLLLAIWAGN